MRVAAIDVGTNTAQLLVADVDGGTVVRRVHTDERFVRLGKGVDASDLIDEAAIGRLIDALQVQRDQAEAHGADHITVGATSASRDALNRQDVIDAVRRETGLPVEILSGDEEATWTFAAACDEHPNRTGPTAVIDIGGGSTEVIVGPGGTVGPDAMQHRCSLDVGCVRFTERFFEDGLPPSHGAVRHATACIDAALKAADLPVLSGAMLIGTSGTTEALALVHAGPSSTIDELSAAARRIAATDVHCWRTHLLTCSVDDVLALHPEVMQGRADVFPMGVLILDRFLHATGLGACHVSRHQLRHGLILRWLHRKARGA
jgi:exopolyphosphatase/guanosine-5'-triphosphate,3'-diphosphate pyrophosphatase